MNDYLSPEAVHDPLIQERTCKLGYVPGCDYSGWKNELAHKFIELLGDMPDPVDPEMEIEYESVLDGMREIRFSLFSEQNAKVPCHLLIPDTGEAPYPLMLCLQGHSSGMHLSLGRKKFEGDEKALAGGRDFGLQAAAQGYAALIVEQRCFGERSDARDSIRKDKVWFKSHCHHASMSALLLGRTMMGERIWDIQRTLDLMAHFPEIDPDNIYLMGHSGGGTAAFYTACLDSRVRGVIASSSICNYRYSIGKIDHCGCNYIPGILNFMEMSDLAALLAPRPLVISTGRHDRIFPLEDVVRTYEQITEIYTKNGAAEKCRLIVGEEGHRFYPDQAWPLFAQINGMQERG